MENTTTKIVSVDPAEYGLDSTRAKEISDFFNPMLSKMVELEESFNELNGQDMSEQKCKAAKELRLLYVKVRTGTAKMVDLIQDLKALKKKYTFESEDFQSDYRRVGDYIDRLIEKLPVKKDKAA